MSVKSGLREKEQLEASLDSIPDKKVQFVAPWGIPASSHVGDCTAVIPFRPSTLNF